MSGARITCICVFVVAIDVGKGAFHDSSAVIDLSNWSGDA